MFAARSAQGKTFHGGLFLKKEVASLLPRQEVFIPTLARLYK